MLRGVDLAVSEHEAVAVIGASAIYAEDLALGFALAAVISFPLLLPVQALT